MSALDCALTYAARGWPVMPVWWPTGPAEALRCACPRGADCASPAKHPLVQHGVRDATRNATVIRRWWDRWPDAGVAIATGRVSGLLVVDVDTAKHPSAAIDLFDAAGPIDTAACVGHVFTGSGGDHYYLDAPNGGPCKVGWPVRGVDLRGDGGYVVAPPSLHVSGGRYDWIERSTFGAPC